APAPTAATPWSASGRKPLPTTFSARASQSSPAAKSPTPPPATTCPSGPGWHLTEDGWPRMARIFTNHC
ncbi:MAG: hypothetical protein KDE28_18875, partial [Anaerolineales bacterium]|nr:hypothetical protein [Anaerolineales bacterium]